MAHLPEELTARLARLAESEGVELVVAEVVGSYRKMIVRLVIDRDEGAVSLADCELVSRQASVLLDAFDPLPGPYSLEVTSPGLDRALNNDRDFARFAGRMVRVRMRSSWEGNRLIEGELLGREGGIVRVTDRAGALHAFPESEIRETRLAPFAEQAGTTAPRGKRKKK